MTEAGHTIGAIELAAALKLPRPTSQQVEIIESERLPALVIAGAGSGKTETMASRVVWLLANGHVEPGEILGLTFTRKAAGELAGRIRERIAQLAATGLMAQVSDVLDPPNVSTYNSFANAIFRDNAIFLGRESDGSILGEASAWQLARSLAVSSRDPRLAELDKSLGQITDAVVRLSHELSENVVDPADVAAMAQRFAALAELPNGGRGQYLDAVTMVSTVGALPILLELAAQFSAAKASRGFVEYADQVMLALQVVRRVERVRQDLRDRYKVVLLDEYQDTSVVQTWLLSELFSGHPVMAVGDPHQSIYGWRGASAANLEQFEAGFGRGAPVLNFALSTSWRNGKDILTAANKIVVPLTLATTVTVEELRASETASAGPVTACFEETIAEEAAVAAAWLKKRLGVAVGKDGKKSTAAMLFRARRTQRIFIEALREAGVDYHVLGIGGLLDEPEVADLVCALTVIADPTAGSYLVRLLAGSRWRVGVRDLKALSTVASKLRDQDYAHRALDDATKQKLRESVAEGEGGSIVDALDFVAHAKQGHWMLEGFTEVGLARLKDAGMVFKRLRARSSLELADFVGVVEQEFCLDIEVMANERRKNSSAGREAFFDAIDTFRAVNEGGGLSAFLGWLKEAVMRDDLAPRMEKAEHGAVQLLTIHGAKGLEWDFVVIPRMVADELPAKPRDSSGWTAFGSLPYEFRGDAESLAVFDWEAAESRKDLLDKHATFSEGVKRRHALEERRLAYVAITRAKHALLLTGSFWSSQASSRAPSTYLVELAHVGVIDALPEAPRSDERPEVQDEAPFFWPDDPLGGRRDAVMRAAENVRSAEPSPKGEFHGEIELLLAERDNLHGSAERVEIPARIPASRFKDFVTAPAKAAAELRRPMPEKPYRATRLGTLFHSWVEERSGVVGSRETIDALASEFDTEVSELDGAELARLRHTFEHSEWATRKPVEVEREIHVPFDGHIIICKIDAVYERDDRFEIVDWKTGKAPQSPEELAERQLQLALYRLAFAQWKGIDPENIDAVFYYVSDDRVVKPDRILGEQELLELWRGIQPSGPR
ncbi:MAG: UvrD-helicase domain-containing protein [Terrimesophilobacter sp.]